MAIRPTLNLAVQGTQINPDPYNENFDMMLSYIDDTIIELNTFVQSQVNSMNNKVTNLRMIGQPIIRLNDILQSDEIRLEGAKVLKSTYASLTSIYGDTYAPPDATDTDTYLYLPDARKRAFWGDETFGYIEAGLPNIRFTFSGAIRGSNGLQPTGACKYLGSPGNIGHDSVQGYYAHYDVAASYYSSVYKDSCNTVQPPAIKFRVVTRYK